MNKVIDDKNDSFVVQILFYVILIGLVIGGKMVIDGIVYGDPTCAFKRCVDVKEIDG